MYFLLLKIDSEVIFVMPTCGYPAYCMCIYTWSRFRGVSVGYSGFLRYTGHPPPAGFRTSFFLDTRLQSCILSCSLVHLVLLLHPLVAPSCCTLVSLVIVLSCPLFIYSI